MMKQIPHKVLYIEEKPIKRQIVFNNRQEYLVFWNTYYRGILDYCWDAGTEKNPNESTYKINPKEYYQYSINLLNKDGSISKPHDGQGFLTPKAKKKQQKNWRKYLEKRKLQTIEAGYRRRLAEMEFKIEYWLKQKGILSAEYSKWKDETRTNTNI